MIEVRLFATLREGRGKIFFLEGDKYSCGTDILKEFQIPEEEVSIFLINGFHSKTQDPVKDGDVMPLDGPSGIGSS